MSSDREQQLEGKVAQQEAELRRLQEELEAAKQQGTSSKPNTTTHRPMSAKPPTRQRYMFSQFPTALLGPPSNGPQLYPCEGHTTIAHDGKIVIFGGTNGSTITNETVAFNIATGRWRRLSSSSSASQQPGPRYGHSAALFNNRMYVYGGFGPGGVTSADGRQQTPSAPHISKTGLLNSFYVLDLRTGDWSCISGYVDNVLPSKNHSAIVHQGKMYLFGGCLAEGRTNALRCFDIERNQWLPTDMLNHQAIACNAPKSSSSGASVLAQSDIPAPRSGHSAVLATRSGHASMIVFGGRLSKFAFCNDVFQYDLSQRMWIRLYCGGDVPQGRCDHSAVLYKDHMVVYGGYAMSEGGSKVYYNDVYTLDLVSCTWTKVELTGPQLPLGSCGHSSVLFETTDNIVCMATIGGWGKVPESVSLADEDTERTIKQHEGDVVYRTINDVWVMQIGKVPEHTPSQPTPSAAKDSRPTSARSSNRTPRLPSRSPRADRPSTARSYSSTSKKGGRPAFVTQSSKAATAKLFGETAVPTPLRIGQASPKRSTDEIDTILRRLTNTKVHEAEMDKLNKKHIKELVPQPMTLEEQQDITDRLFYQQLLLQDERRKALESKYFPSRDNDKTMEVDHINEIVSRLAMPIERPELEPVKAAHHTTKSQEAKLLKRLYLEDTKERTERFFQLEKKYIWGPPAPKKSADEIQLQVARLAAPLSHSPRN